MPIFEDFPYTNIHELNLDWLIKEVAKVNDKYDEIDEAVETTTVNAESSAESARQSTNVLSQVRSLKTQCETIIENGTQDIQNILDEGVEDIESIESSLLSNIDAINTELDLHNTQIATNTANIQINAERISEIASLPSGSTSGDAELIDGRVGADGVTYSSIGNAIRGQYTLLNNILDSMKGYRNFYIDPFFTLFKDDTTDRVDINKFIYNYTRYTGDWEYVEATRGMRKVAGSGTATCFIGCEINYKPDYFPDGYITFAFNLTRSPQMTKIVRVSTRFIDAEGTTISTEYTQTSSGGRIVFTNQIPANTARIFCWVQSSDNEAWRVNNPVIVAGQKDVECSSLLFDVVYSILNSTYSVAYVYNINDLQEALAKGVSDIYIADNFTVNTSTGLTIDNVCNIYGQGKTITFTGGTASTTYLTITNNVNIYDLTLIGDRTCLNLLKTTNSDNNIKVNIYNSKIDSAYNSVVSIALNSNTLLENCVVCNSYHNDCIGIRDNAIAVVRGCKVFNAFDEGLSSHNSSYVEVYDSEFYHCGYDLDTGLDGASSCFGGCHIGGGKMGKVIGCYSHDNVTHGITFINFQQDLPDDVEVCLNNVATNNRQFGMIFTYCKHLTACGNTSLNNGRDQYHNMTNVLFGVEHTHSSPIGVVSSGYVGGNTFTQEEQGTGIHFDNGYNFPDLKVYTILQQEISHN